MAAPTRRPATMNILLAVDGSTYTKRMLAYLATHSELFATTAVATEPITRLTRVP